MQKGERTREAILKEAVDLATVVGLNGLTIGTLASHTGLSKSGLFQHFGSKEALQIATLKHGVTLFEEQVVRPALKRPRGVERVHGDKAVLGSSVWPRWTSRRRLRSLGPERL